MINSKIAEMVKRMSQQYKYQVDTDRHVIRPEKLDAQCEGHIAVVPHPNGVHHFFELEKDFRRFKEFLDGESSS